jgi:hypothetical protein
MILLTLLTLTGCSSLSLFGKNEPEIQVVTKVEKTTVPLVSRPKAVQLNDVKIYVVSKENYDEFVTEFEKKNGGDAYIAISVKDYENLSLNFAELRRYIEQQKQIIVYYENAVKPEEPKEESK